MKWYEGILIAAAIVGIYRLLTSKPDSTSPESALALSHNDSLLAAFEQAIEENPNDVMAYLSQAVTLHSMGRDAEALESLDRAIEIDPDNAEAYRLRDRVREQLPEESD